MKIETPVLRRLGPIPFWRGEGRCLDLLQRLYTQSAEEARRRLDKLEAAEK